MERFDDGPTSASREEQTLETGREVQVESSYTRSLMTESGHRDAPSVVERAEQARSGNGHLVEEEFCEGQLASHRAQRSHRDARRGHVDQETADPSVLGRIRVGAHVELAPVSMAAEAVP